MTIKNERPKPRDINDIDNTIDLTNPPRDPKAFNGGIMDEENSGMTTEDMISNPPSEVLQENSSVNEEFTPEVSKTTTTLKPKAQPIKKAVNKAKAKVKSAVKKVEKKVTKKAAKKVVSKAKAKVKTAVKKVAKKVAPKKKVAKKVVKRR